MNKKILFDISTKITINEDENDLCPRIDGGEMENIP